MSRSRSVCFTINNYTEDEVRELTENLKVQDYYVFQRERGENGTPHIQGYCHSKNQKSLSAWKRIVGQRAHIEFARGDALSNKAYCTKESTREPGTQPVEGGSLPVQGQRSDLEAVAKRVRDGASDQEIAEDHPGDLIRYHKGISYLRSLYDVPRNFKTKVYWWYGPTGTGKTREAFERFPDAYFKMGCNKWWDGYRGQDTVIIDDFRRDFCTFAELLRLLDRYPMLVEAKGSSMHFRSRNIVITTPRGPRATWAGRTEEDLEQLCRRIDEVRFFGEGEPPPDAAHVYTEVGAYAPTFGRVTEEDEDTNQSLLSLPSSDASFFHNVYNDINNNSM